MITRSGWLLFLCTDHNFNGLGETSPSLFLLPLDQAKHSVFRFDSTKIWWGFFGQSLLIWISFRHVYGFVYRSCLVPDGLIVISGFVIRDSRFAISASHFAKRGFEFLRTQERGMQLGSLMVWITCQKQAFLPAQIALSSICFCPQFKLHLKMHFPGPCKDLKYWSRYFFPYPTPILVLGKKWSFVQKDHWRGGL